MGRPEGGALISRNNRAQQEEARYFFPTKVMVSLFIKSPPNFFFHSIKVFKFLCCVRTSNVPCHIADYELQFSAGSEQILLAGEIHSGVYTTQSTCRLRRYKVRLLIEISLSFFTIGINCYKNISIYCFRCKL